MARYCRLLESRLPLRNGYFGKRRKRCMETRLSAYDWPPFCARFARGFRRYFKTWICIPERQRRLQYPFFILRSPLAVQRGCPQACRGEGGGGRETVPEALANPRDTAILPLARRLRGKRHFPPRRGFMRRLGNSRKFCQKVFENA